jgi:hypothetical protein
MRSLFVLYLVTVSLWCAAALDPDLFVSPLAETIIITAAFLSSFLLVLAGPFLIWRRTR